MTGIRIVQESLDIRLVTVSNVDNQGEPCNYCDWDTADAGVKANVYLPVDDSSRGEVKSCCLRCVVPIVREVSGAAFRILVEVAE